MESYYSLKQIVQWLNELVQLSYSQEELEEELDEEFSSLQHEAQLQEIEKHDSGASQRPANIVCTSSIA